MCDVCYGVFNCPVCGEEPEMDTCSFCEGAGTIFFDEDYNSISYEEAKIFKLKGKYVREEECSECHGTGEVEI